MTEIEVKQKWGKEYSERFSPIYNPNKPEPETGRTHEWILREDSYYYDNIYRCKSCGKKNWGWNLWKEDWLPTCKGVAKEKAAAK